NSRAAQAPAVDAAAHAHEPLSFGGPLGNLVMMVLLPLLTVYLWACVHVQGGALWPTRALLGALPRPSLTALGWIAGFIAFEALLDVVLPGRAYTGAPQKDGKRRTYRLNGLFSLVVTLAVLAALLATGKLHGTEVLAQLGSMVVTSILLVY